MKTTHWLHPYNGATLLNCQEPERNTINLCLWFWPIIQLLYSTILLAFLSKPLLNTPYLTFIYDLIFLLLLILFIVNIGSLKKLATGNKKGFPLFYLSALLFQPFSLLPLYYLNLLAYNKQKSRASNESIVYYSLAAVGFGVICTLGLLITFIMFRGLIAMPLVASDPDMGLLEQLITRIKSWRFFFRHNSLTSFLFSTRWEPLAKPPNYGILSFIWGSVQVTLLALLIAAPIGLGCAIYIAEFAPKKLGILLRNVSELLAGLPSVIYGFFGSILIVPMVRYLFPSDINTGFNAISGGIILALMILPTIINISEVSLRAVPASLSAGSLALGATQLQTIRHITVPAAISGILTSIILGACRAIGETLAVLMVAGNAIKFAWLPIEPTRTLTMNIIAEMAYAQDDPTAGSYHLTSLFTTSIVLMIFIFSLNILLSILRKRIQYRFNPT